MEAFLQDLRLACRQLARRPLFAAVAVLTLAVGMGLNAVVFSAVNALFLKGNAMSDIEGAVWISTTGPRGGTADVSLAELERFTDATRGAIDTAALGRMPLAWQRGSTSEPIWAQIVSSEYLRLVEVRPIAGRLLGSFDSAQDRPFDSAQSRPSTSGSMPEVVIGERLWRRRLDAAPLGNLQLTLNGIEHAVVGVLPERFRGPGGTFAPDVWTPLERWRDLRLPDTLAAIDHRWLGIIGRITPGVSVAEAEARLSSAAAALAREWPATHEGRSARLLLMRDGHPELRSLTRLAFVAMTGTGLVLLLACFNLATLLIARGVERQKEMGIRAALGAGSSRLVRQLVTEGLVLALASGAVTLIVAAWSQQLLTAFALPSPIPQRIDLSLDGTVIAFIVALIVVAGVLPGLLPALHAARVDLGRALSARGAGTSRPSRTRHALIVAQVIGSTVLLTAAALFVQSVARLAAADPGFESTNAIVIETEPALQGYDATRTRLLVDRLADRLRGQPGIVDVAIADRVPFYVGYPRTTEVSIAPGQCASAQCPTALTYAVGDGFFHTLGIPLLAGRAIERTSSAQSVVVSEAFAQSWWPGTSAIGQVLYLTDTGRAHIVVGVARDTKHRTLLETTRTPVIYVPITEQDFGRAVTLVARTDRSPGALVRSVADAAHAVDPAAPPQSIKTMTERMENARWPARTATGFFTVCGGLALLLATIGLFAVVSHMVNQRTRELGVRLAIGATPRMLVRDVLSSGAWLVVPGTIAGLLVAFAGARSASAIFMGVDSGSPVAYLSVAALQGVIALAACAIPARRAAGVDPLTSLRAE